MSANCVLCTCHHVSPPPSLEVGLLPLPGYRGHRSLRRSGSSSKVAELVRATASLIPKHVFFLLHFPGSEMAERTYCVLRQGQDDMNQWPQAAAIPLLFPSAWPCGSEDEPGSGGIYPFSLRIGSRGSVCLCVWSIKGR